MAQRKSSVMLEARQRARKAAAAAEIGRRLELTAAEVRSAPKENRQDPVGKAPKGSSDVNSAATGNTAEPDQAT